MTAETPEQEDARRRKDYQDAFRFRETEKTAWPTLSLEARVVYLATFMHNNAREDPDLRLFMLLVNDALLDGNTNGMAVARELRQAGMAYHYPRIPG